MPSEKEKCVLLRGYKDIQCPSVSRIEALDLRKYKKYLQGNNPPGFLVPVLSLAVLKYRHKKQDKTNTCSPF